MAAFFIHQILIHVRFIWNVLTIANVPSVQKNVAKCDSEQKGFGVFAQEKIPAGHFVVEYVGELVSKEEAEGRLTSQQHHNYLFTIREFIGGECRYTFIDGRYKGNISRFINHSCEPNLFLQVFRLGRASLHWQCLQVEIFWKEKN
ncbi:unnamed protein product [Meloidogyne enterolobii]|uniref:Uncharacterized protein n=1 Tax=Meloidogyne enterolobii TaxID=390850 RepID=A0ACB1B068_MELEN